MSIFWVKSSLKIGRTFFLHQFKSKIIFNFVIFVATKIGRTKFFIRPSLLHKSSFKDFFCSGTLFFEIYFLLVNDQNSTYSLLKDFFTYQMLIFLKFITPSHIDKKPKTKSVLYHGNCSALLCAEDRREISTPGRVHVNVEGEPLLAEPVSHRKETLQVVHGPLLDRRTKKGQYRQQQGASFFI
jgi:hypothetical protein